VEDDLNEGKKSPFAYKRFKTIEFIDHAVFIDTPLDNCVSR